MACDLRNVPFFFFAFHSCPFPSNYSPSIPSSSTHWVHACTYASSILSPPLLRSYLSILLSNLRSLFRPTEWTMVVVVVDGDAGGDGQRLPHPSFLPCLSILPPLPPSSTILLPSKRRKERNAAELQRAQSRG